MQLTSFETEVRRLEVRISGLSTSQDRLESELYGLRKKVKHQQGVVNVAIAKIRARRFADRIGLPRAIFVSVLILLIGAISFVVIDLVIGSRTISSGLAVVLALLTFAGVVFLLYVTADEELAGQQEEALGTHENLKIEQGRSEARFLKVTHEIKESAARLVKAKHRVQDLQRIENVSYQLKVLYRENWRAMRSIEFEDYLEQVLRVQGYLVETTKVTGDQGVDLVVSKHGVRIAIQVKGYHHSVGNAAVQQAFAGMAHYLCDQCAVITNSRFSSSAVELAGSTNCVLIHEHNFRDFVLGQFELISPV